MILRAANSQVLEVKSQIKVNIKYLDKVYNLPLVISDDRLPSPLIDRDWLDVLVPIGVIKLCLNNYQK